VSDGDGGLRSPRGGLDADLLSDFGHQLRNQLNAIVGAAGLLSATATSSDQRELASIVLVGSEQLAGLVDDVLDASLIRSGGFELALHPFDIRASVEGCLALVAGTAVGKGMDLAFTADASVPSVVVGDSRRLEQILHALLRLAVGPTEGGRIEVQLRSEPRGGMLELGFRVRSSATVPARIVSAGLSGTQPEAGWEPGDRLAVLSLVTTKQLVEMMDGELSVRDGGGTEFDFTLLAEPSANAGVGKAAVHGMQVLVVASEPTERRVLALQAELWGAPSTVADAAEAQGLVQSGQAFDLALIEHRRPMIDGLEVAAQLRSLRGRHELPIVLIVAGALGDEEATAADNGLVQATLTKPVAPHKLHDVMAQIGIRKAAAPEVEVQPLHGALRVLVADDNSLNQTMLRRQVAKLGHRVDVVANGRQAVDAIAQQAYDAVLMDVLMPEMDGLQAAEEICRRWSPGTRPRLIALTAMAGPGDEERCRKAGFDDYLSKPVHLDELGESLKAAAGWRAAPKPMG
jgi:CheY-like chemotaxis protein